MTSVVKPSKKKLVPSRFDLSLVRECFGRKTSKMFQMSFSNWIILKDKTTSKLYLTSWCVSSDHDGASLGSVRVRNNVVSGGYFKRFGGDVTLYITGYKIIDMNGIIDIVLSDGHTYRVKRDNMFSNVKHHPKYRNGPRTDMFDFEREFYDTMLMLSTYEF